MKDNDLDDNVEYYSGICSIEEAIRLYINKYARTTKVCDLVLSFNNRLNELATLARLEGEIPGASRRSGRDARNAGTCLAFQKQR